MKSFLTKTAAAASGVVVFCIACVFAGLGLSVIALLAMFSLTAACLALLAAPFLSWADASPDADAPEAQ